MKATPVSQLGEDEGLRESHSLHWLRVTPRIFLVPRLAREASNEAS